VNLIQPLGNRVLLSTGADWQLRRLRKLAAWLDLGFDIQNYFDWREPKQAYDARFPPWKAGTYGYWDDSVLAIYPFLPTPDYLAERCEMLVNSVPTISTFYINFKLLLKSLDDGFNWAEALHRHNIRLDAWTVDADKPNAAENAKRLFDMGVDQFTTNTPAALEEMLKART
jgi:glycerophosphoryl diester phosphodiesterase